MTALPINPRSLPLPLLALAALAAALWLVGDGLRAGHEARERSLREAAHSLASLVEHELQQRRTVALLLEQSRWLDQAPELPASHLEQFERRAREAMPGVAGWVELRSESRVLLDTRWPAYSRPPARDTAPRQPLRETPQLRPLHLDEGAPHEAHADLVVPVQRNGRTRLNLVLALRPSELQRAVDAQAAAEGWVGLVVDPEGKVVARHPGTSAAVGQAVPDDLRRHIGVQPQGRFDGVLPDGRRASGWFATSPEGWSSIAAMGSEEPLARPLSRTGLGTLLLAALGVAGAAWALWRKAPAAVPDEAANTVPAAAERAPAAHEGHGRRREALGRLAGSVAHDFNNLLGVISNHLHLVRRHPSAPELQAPLAAVQRALDNGSRLAQHLQRLAGGRAAGPRPVELARALPELRELLHDVLGRRTGLSLRVDEDAAQARVDGAELELALLQLALDAREARPAGGELRLHARLEAHPDGREACVCFAREDEGAAREGARVPVLPAAAAGPDSPESSAAGLRGLGVLSVLLVDPALQPAATPLQTPGLQLVHAADAAQALQALDQDAGLDAVLCEVATPEGLALARRLRRERPQLAMVLLAAPGQAAVDEGMVLLHKPFGAEDLQRALRTARAVAGFEAAAAP